MHPVRDYPSELRGTIDPQLYRRLEQLYQLIYALQQVQQEAPARIPIAVRQQLQLLGVLREPLIGQETPDPNLSTAATVPGTVTDITGASGSGNITVTVTSGGPGNSQREITVTLTATPTFTTVNVTGHYMVAGTQVVGAQQPAIADPAGGVTIDVEGRAATVDILNALRAHGLIA